MSPHPPSAYHAQGLAFEASGNLWEAVREFSKCLESDPSTVEAAMDRGQCYLKLTMEMENSDNVYLFLLAKHDFYSVITQLADSQANLDLLARARKYARECTSAYELAIDFVQKMNLRSRNQDAVVYWFDAHDAMQTECFDVAISDLNKALELEPAFIEALCGRAFCNYRQNDFQAACFDLEKALELEPNHTTAFRLLTIVSPEEMAAVEEYQAELREDLNAANVTDQRIVRALLHYEHARSREESEEPLKELLILGDRITKLAKLRAKRSAPLRKRWMMVLVLLRSPAAESAIARQHTRATGESLESMSTTDLIDIVKRGDFMQQLRVRSIGSILAHRDDSAIQDLLSAIRDHVRQGKAIADPEPFLCMLMAARIVGPRIVPGVIDLLRDETLYEGHENFIKLLGEIGDPSALPHLNEIREEWSKAGSQFVEWSIQQIHPS